MNCLIGEPTDKEYEIDLYDCVAAMLEDHQLEVRLGASSTLSGMIRCSPAHLRSRIVSSLNKKFTDMLLSHPLPKKPKSYIGGAAKGMSTPNTGTSTPTPEHTKLVVTRHAAVLGLGALVQAFPYASPPPTWIPGVLTTVSASYLVYVIVPLSPFVYIEATEKELMLIRIPIS